MICNICPRRCGADRKEYSPSGVCASPALPMVARAAPHFGEEPCISGSRGSGAVFFCGCNLRCVFCQNAKISRGGGGKTVSPERLAEIFLELQDKGVHNINLVTPTHYTDPIITALKLARLRIPVVWNSSAYESAEALRRLDGLVQIYMPDLKYMKRDLAARYSAAPDYPEQAAAAIAEMYRQTGSFVLDSEGMLQSGVLIRHLILPGAEENSKAVIDYVAGQYPGESVLFSLMAQYTPTEGAKRFPELRGTVSPETNERLLAYMLSCGISCGFWQEPEAATEDMIPEFDLTGV